MNRTRILFCALGLLLLGLAAPLRAAWTHFAPAQASVAQPLRLEFLDPEGLQAPAEALLFLELDGRGLNPLPAAELNAGRVVFSVPLECLQGRELAYRAEIRFPDAVQRAPESGQWRVTLAPEQELALVELLSEPEIAPGEETLLAFSAAGDGADLASAALWIDGQPAPGELEADPWLVTWRGMLPAGEHQVELRLKDAQGRELPPQRLLLKVLGAEAVPTGFEASAWQEFNMDYQDSRTSEWQRYHAGQMRFRAWRGRGEQAWELKGRVLLSALDLERDELQPQSRLSLDLERGGFLLGVGDRQPEYGQAILSGTRVRGVELQADFRDFGLRAVGGRSQAARDPLFGAPGEVDFAGAYARNLYALDLRMGPRYGLFEGGLTILKVKDDEGSLNANPPDSWGVWGEDSLGIVRPQDNAGLALRLDMNAFRGHFSMRNQAAFAFYNSDISGGPWSKEDLETFGAGELPDPKSFEDIIVVNDYFSPLDLVNGDVLNATALMSNWQLNTGPNQALIDFRRVGGAYRSLGNAFLTPDQQEIRLTDRFRVLQNQVYADLGLGRSTDNLDGQYDKTVGTLARDILSLGLGWYPRGRDFQARLGLESQQEANEALDLLEDGADDAEERTARSQQIEGGLLQVSLGLSGSFAWLERRHQWSLNVVNQGYGDDVGRVLDPDDGDAVLRADRSYSSGQYGLGWRTSLPLETSLDAGFSIYGSDYDDDTMTDYGYWSLRAALGRAWLGGRLESTLRSQFQNVTAEVGNTQDAFTRLDLGGQADWRFRPGLTLGGRLDWQSWAGDRDDSFFKIVMRLSQEF